MYFLDQVAKQLYTTYGSSLNRHCLVFPNRRAGLFLMKYLAASAGKPLWAPRVITINELFVNCSGLKKAGNERLVFELYRIYRSIAKTEETFDNFYFWGEMLLNDFDDVDKYLIDAAALFTNLSDLHAIDEKFGGLTDEQMEIIRQFIINFRAGSETDHKRDFEFTWSVLFPLYTGFKRTLAANGLAYEGMIFREVASAVGQGYSPGLLNEYEQYHFIGFNALNNCEKQLFKQLKKEGKASFYWDYSDNLFFRADTKAGFFILPNIKDFGQNLQPQKTDQEINQNGGNGETRNIKIIDIPSDAGQAKLIPGLVSGMKIDLSPDKQHHTAIILADENLLPAVLSSIPAEIKDINVTMGYPFSMTVVYSLLRALLDLQERPVRSGATLLFDYRKVIPVLSNPLIMRVAGQMSSEKIADILKRNSILIPTTFFDDNQFLKSLFHLSDDALELCNYLKTTFFSITEALQIVSEGSKQAVAEPDKSSPVLNDPLTPEFLYRANQVLNRLEPLLSDTSITISREIFIRLADRVFREIKVPFRGEPLHGIQVMGLLESRSLDFDNIIILSANEGVLPKSSAGSSYIPYNLREAFGLPTINYQDSIFSYYFTRLISRASNITCVYNSSPEGMRTGEMSRFLLRLKYSRNFSPEYSSVFTRMNQRAVVAQERSRTPADILSLENKYLSGEKSSVLSPSAINTWLRCSMKFYYAYVCNIREPDSITAGIDPARFGTILHEVVSLVYQPFKGQIITPEIIDSVRKDKTRSDEIINLALRKVLYGGTGAPFTGTGLVTSDIVRMYLGKVLNIDHTLAPFTIISLEESFRSALKIKYGNSEREIHLGGTIDRIDEREGVRRLIDYKTGNADNAIKSLEELFDTSSRNMNDAAVQTMIYCVIMSDKEGFSRLRPVIYALRSSNRDEFEDRLVVEGTPIDDFRIVSETFHRFLTAKISELFDNSGIFSMTKVLERCKYCPYKNLCQR